MRRFRISTRRRLQWRSKLPLNNVGARFQSSRIVDQQTNDRGGLIFSETVRKSVIVRSDGLLRLLFSVFADTAPSFNQPGIQPDEVQNPADRMIDDVID